MERTMHVMEAVIGCLALAALPACGPSAPDLDDVKRDQREILFRLGRLDRSVEGAATQPAAAPAAPEVKTYPDEDVVDLVGVRLHLGRCGGRRARRSRSSSSPTSSVRRAATRATW